MYGDCSKLLCRSGLIYYVLNVAAFVRLPRMCGEIVSEVHWVKVLRRVSFRDFFEVSLFFNNFATLKI